MAVEVDSAPTETGPQEAALSSLRRSLIWVSLSFGILNFVLPIYGKEIGASAIEIGMLFSAFSLMIVILRPLVGAGLDRYGRRWFYLIGLLLYGLAMLVFAFSRDVWTLLAARIVQGSGSAVLWLAVSAIVADTAQVDQRGSSFGSVSQVTNQGAIIGTFIGFAALSSLEIVTGWRALFFFYAGACALAIYIAWRSVLETRPAAREKEKTRLSDGLRAVLRSRSLLGLMITGLVTGASAAMVAPIWMIFLQEKLNAGVDVIAWAALPGALVWAVLPARLGKLADRFGRKPLILLSMFVAAAVSFLIPQMDSLVPLAVLWAIEAICFAASEPSSEAMVTDLTNPDQRGHIFGIFAFIGGLGAVIGPIGGGWLYDTFSQAAPFYLNGAVMAASAGVLWLMLKEDHRG